MADSKHILLFDFASRKGSVPWNPNTWKARYSLNYKELAYETVWLEYPDVEPTLQAVGVPPSGTKPNGSPLYTLPAIVDRVTGEAISDSFLIAEYLDKRYPDRPTILPIGTRALQAAFLDAMPNHPFPIFRFTLQKTVDNILSPRSEIYCRAAWRAIPEVLGGQLLEDAFPKEEDIEGRKKEWEIFEESMGRIAKWIEAGRFAMGDTVSFADFALAGMLQWFKMAWGEKSSEWKKLLEMHGGRWRVLLESLERYS